MREERQVRHEPKKAITSDRVDHRAPGKRKEDFDPYGRHLMQYRCGNVALKRSTILVWCLKAQRNKNIMYHSRRLGGDEGGDLGRWDGARPITHFPPPVFVDSCGTDWECACLYWWLRNVGQAKSWKELGHKPPRIKSSLGAG
ncbi:MAG: hypothetical protein Q9203_004318 [Teloschistes exilis]